MNNSDMEIIHAKGLKQIPSDYSTLKFGQYFTDYMFTMEYKPPEGWIHAKIIPYGMLALDPAASCLHYGQEIFEGMKCYKSPSGKIQLFRPEMNFQRMNNSADRMCMPRLDIPYVINALKTLIRLEARWVPDQRGTSLYIRPTMIADEPFLGVHSAHEFLFYIILSPAGPYFKEGFKPIKIMVEDRYIRAAPGGSGEAKCAGNYGASLIAGEDAVKRGYSQVLWLDGRQRKYAEEVGAMNIAFIINGEILTPSLQGTILPGITRDSVIHLARHLGYKITERRISITEVITAAKNGTLHEMFGMGTAAIIAPVGWFQYKKVDYTVNQGKVGSIAQTLFDELTGIQSGRKPDPFGWIVEV